MASLAKTARTMEPQRDAESGGGGKAAVSVQQPEGLYEVGTIQHHCAADRTRCDEPKPAEGQAADKVLGEDGEPLLDAFVPSEPGAEHAQALQVSREVGVEVHADLVAEQRLDPAPRHDRAASDQQARARHHHPGGNVVADLYARIERGTLCAIALDHAQAIADSSAQSTLACRRPLAAIAPAIGRQQDFIGDAQQLRSHRPVKHARGLPEPGGIAQLQKGELQVEFLLLFPIDEVEQRVLQVGEGNRVQPPLLDVDLERQRPVEQPGCPPEAARPEILPGDVGVDGRYGEQEVERARDLVDPLIESANRFDEQPPPERAMARHRQPAGLGE